MICNELRGSALVIVAAQSCDEPATQETWVSRVRFIRLNLKHVSNDKTRLHLKL
jgi:hypothetical protein